MEPTKSPASPVAQSSAENQLHFLDYWRIIRIRKTIILAVFLLVVLTATAVTFLLPKSYSSLVRLAVEKDATDIDPLGRSQAPMQFDPYFVQTEFEKIQSTAVLYPVIEDRVTNEVDVLPSVPKEVFRFNLRSNYAFRYYNEKNEPLSVQETYRLLRKNLDVKQARNTSLIEIKVYSEDKEEAAGLANAIAHSYRNWRLKTKKDQSQAGIEELWKNLTNQTEQVRILQNKVDELRVSNSIPDSLAEAAGYQSSVERERVSALEGERTRAEAEAAFWQTKLANLKGLDRKELRKAILTAVASEQLLPQLYTELSTTEQMLAQLMKDYSPEHPDVVRRLALQQKINQQIEERLDGILIGLENQVVAARARLETAKRQLEEGKQEAALMASKTRPYFTAKRDLENQQRIRDAVFLRHLQESVDKGMPRGSIVQITDKAEPGLKPVRPNIPLNIFLGVVVGLVMGVGLAFFIEYLDTSVKTIDDVERALQAPVLGVIPQNVGVLSEEGADSAHAEAYRVLRTNVLFSRKNPGANTLTVVSGGAGEGKSTTILNLSTVFAQNGQRVLLVDSDLRRPSLHKYINVSNAVGLTNYLLKQNTLEQVIQTTKTPGLDFLPSGKLPSSSLGILNSARMKEFIKEIKERYDFVFFDSPPIMGVSDASVLASEVDLAILVVQYRKYPQAMTIRAKQMVEKVGGNLLGVVLNNINISQDSYYYYYSGYYYDYYSKNEEKEGKHPSKKNGQGDAPAGGRAESVEVKSKY